MHNILVKSWSNNRGFVALRFQNYLACKHMLAVKTQHSFCCLPQTSLVLFEKLLKKKGEKMNKVNLKDFFLWGMFFTVWQKVSFWPSSIFSTWKKGKYQTRKQDLWNNSWEKWTLCVKWQSRPIFSVSYMFGYLLYKS